MSSPVFFLVMMACCYPVALIITGFLANGAKPKKNIVIGVTLPKEAQEDPAVQAICARYRKKLKYCALLLTAVLVPVFFIPSFSVMLTAWLCWLLGAILLPYVVYLKAYRQLRALKRENSWYIRAMPAAAETEAVLKRPHSRLLFLPALVVSLVPLWPALRAGGPDLVYGAVLAGSAAAIVLMGLLCYPLIYRQRPEFSGSDEGLNRALTNLRRHRWGLCWILLASLTALLSLGLWFGRNNMVLTMVAICLYALGAMILAAVTEWSVRRGQEHLTASRGGDQYLDEDDLWHYGLFYDNPKDRRFLVNDRVGMGTSVNLARPGAKALMVFTALVLACLPLVGVWCMVEEYTPIRVVATADHVQVEHLAFDLTVAYEDVEEAVLLDQLPGMSRVAGTSMETVDKGRFTVKGYGACRICLDPRADAFLVLRTKDHTYLISTASKAETERIYQWIQAAQSQ